MNKQTQEALQMAVDFLDGSYEAHKVRKACQEALEQPLTRDWKHTIDERIARDSEFKEALEQPTQKYIVNNTASTQFRLYEQPAQEPIYIIGEGWNCDKFPELGTKLYTHPKQWQGLTDDEIEELHHKWIMNSGNKDTQYDFARAIEQALKEKNHGN